MTRSIGWSTAPLALCGALLVFACDDGGGERAVGIQKSPPPTVFGLTATSTAVAGATGSVDLGVRVVVRNAAATTDTLLVGDNCAPNVTLTPSGDATGVSAANACPSSATHLPVSPGDSIVLTRIIPSATLSGLAPGSYVVYIAITSSKYVSGVGAGTISLPLKLQ